MRTRSCMTTGVVAIAAAFLSLTPAAAADPRLPPAAVQPAEKQHFTKLGMLTCSSRGGIGYLIGSSTQLSCTFNNAGASDVFESYDGTITKVGPDLGFTRSETLLWAVYAPSHQVPQGRLDGTYVGVSASAAIGLGLGANVLVGNFRDNINLVPVSVSGSVGLSAAAGIGALTLNSTAAAQ